MCERERGPFLSKEEFSRQIRTPPNLLKQVAEERELKDSNEVKDHIRLVQDLKEQVAKLEQEVITLNTLLDIERRRDRQSRQTLLEGLAKYPVNCNGGSSCSLVRRLIAEAEE